MEKLKELIKIITPQRLKNIKLLGKKESQVSRLYWAIHKENAENDDMGREVLFGKSKKNKKLYSDVKYTLTKRLIDIFFLIDVEKTMSEYQRNYHYCYKEYAVSKMLIGMWKKNIAIWLAEKTFKKCKKYELVELCLSLSRELQLHYGAIVGDKSKFEQYNSLVKKYSELLALEIKAQNYYTDLVFNFTKSRASQLALGEKASQYSQEMKKDLEQFDSFRLNLLAYNIIITNFQIKNDYLNVIKVSSNAVAYFQNRAFQPTTTIFSFLFKQIPANIQLKNYDETNTKIIECLKLVTIGTYNWNVIMVYKAILSFHAEQYEIAEKTVESAKSITDIKHLKEQWLIIEAYVYFFGAIGKIKYWNNDKFKLARFLNEVPVFSKDKRGNNISILILQFLFLLQRKNLGLMIDKVEALKKYKTRHLEGIDTVRSNCFIEMLLILVKHSFKRKIVLKEVNELKQKLWSMPVSVQGSEIEIVPYEILWNCILDLLD